MTLRKIGPGLLCALLLPWGDSASAQPLDEAAAKLLASHPQIRAGEANVLAAEDGVQRALAGYLPRVNLNGRYAFENIDSPARRQIQGEASNMPAQNASVTITQNLFDGFRTQAEHESASINVQFTEAELESTRQAVLFEGVTAYLDVLRRRRQVALALSNVETIQEQLNLEDERVQRGAGIGVDVLLAKSRLQTAKERLVAIQGELENTVTRFIQVFDIVPQPVSMAVPDLPINRLPRSIDEAIDMALADNPSVLSSNRSVDLAEIQKQQARSEYYPTFDLIGEYAIEQDLAGVSGTRRDLTVGVQATWEIFSGFATDANVAEAVHLHKASLDNHNFVNRKVVEEVGIAWQNLRTARDRVLLLENAVNIAAEVHDSFRRLRDAGQATAFEVLDSQNEIFDAAINLESAEFDARVAVYQLLRAMGRLTMTGLEGGADDRPMSEILRHLRFEEAPASDGPEGAAYAPADIDPVRTDGPASEDGRVARDDVAPRADAAIPSPEAEIRTGVDAGTQATSAPQPPRVRDTVPPPAETAAVSAGGASEVRRVDVDPMPMPSQSDRGATRPTETRSEETAPVISGVGMSAEEAALIRRNLQRNWSYE